MSTKSCGSQPKYKPSKTPSAPGCVPFKTPLKVLGHLAFSSIKWSKEKTCWGEFLHGQSVASDIEAERGKAVAEEIDAARGICDFFPSRGLNAVANAVYPLHSCVDVVVNAGSILENAIRVVDMNIDEFDALWRVNVRGTLLVTQVLGRRMCAAGSGAITRCSLTSYRPSPRPSYAAGKAALKMLTKIEAAEFGPRGVRVDAVALLRIFSFGKVTAFMDHQPNSSFAGSDRS